MYYRTLPLYISCAAREYLPVRQDYVHNFMESKDFWIDLEILWVVQQGMNPIETQRMDGLSEKCFADRPTFQKVGQSLQQTTCV